MEFIKKQQIKFQNLVINHFSKKYNLKHVYIRNNSKLDEVDENNIYIFKNNVILNNRIVNRHYSLTKPLDENKYSIFSILFKNLKYRKTQDHNICELNRDIKKNITNDTIRLSSRIKNLDKIINVIGRKYKNKSDCSINNNSIGLKCIVTESRIERHHLKREKDEKEELIITNKNKKKFIEQLEYQNKSNAIYLDIEYVNDISDDLNKFPISNDSSMVFMIGIVDNDKKFTNFAVDKLESSNEYNILSQYLDYLKSKIINKNILYIYHWSNADVLLITKGLKRYTDLYKKFQDEISEWVRYVDLLVIVKNSIKLKSYSLKYVAKVLLNREYDTDCKNGFDAMMSIIMKNREIKDKKADSLKNYNITNDIIEYNKLDTVLLYELMVKFKE